MNSVNSNSYLKQKERALKRKKEIIELKGGKCCLCGYNKNYAALEFHHLDSLEKDFSLDSRRLSNTTVDKILKELEKCILVCSNCHKELHYPDLEIENINFLLENFKTNNKSIFSSKYKVSSCKECNVEFKYIKGKKFCSNECQWNNHKKQYLNYPSYKEVIEKYEELNSWEKVSNYFNLTRKIIQGIRKRKD